MRPIDQQTALVTGATDGMGKTLAGELAGARSDCPAARAQ